MTSLVGLQRGVSVNELSLGAQSMNGTRPRCTQIKLLNLTVSTREQPREGVSRPKWPVLKAESLRGQLPRTEVAACQWAILRGPAIRINASSKLVLAVVPADQQIHASALCQSDILQTRKLATLIDSNTLGADPIVFTLGSPHARRKSPSSASSPVAADGKGNCCLHRFSTLDRTFDSNFPSSLAVGEDLNFPSLPDCVVLGFTRTGMTSRSAAPPITTNASPSARSILQILAGHGLVWLEDKFGSNWGECGRVSGRSGRPARNTA